MCTAAQEIFLIFKVRGFIVFYANNVETLNNSLLLYTKLNKTGRFQHYCKTAETQPCIFKITRQLWKCQPLLYPVHLKLSLRYLDYQKKTNKENKTAVNRVRHNSFYRLKGSFVLANQ